ncbi:MAG TPA: hypothetical protein VLM79_16945 [Kofleriaceae bacterium]|nr:hypothetical protein [Kofleriaceae bacterium]
MIRVGELEFAVKKAELRYTRVPNNTAPSGVRRAADAAAWVR